MSDFIKRAKEIYGTLAESFHDEVVKCGPSSYANYWQVSCVFDTMLDYQFIMKRAGSCDPVS